LLEGSPYNCVLLTWSLGEPLALEAEQRKLAGEYAALVKGKGLSALAVIEPGPEWPAAVEAAAEIFDGVVLEGDFPEGAAEQSLEKLRSKNPDAVVVPLTSWQKAKRDARFPVLASNTGLWPGMLTPSEAEGAGAGPTSNPWILSNGWQIGVMRADGLDRPVWMAHRPNPRRPQPLVFQDYFRAVADSGMARARWAVTVGNEWRPGLFAGEEEALKQWRQLGEYVLWFEKQNQDYSSFAIWPSVVVVHDPKRQSTFDSFDILNMLAVRHVPHQVVLRQDLRQEALEAQTKVLAFDLAPPQPVEFDALQSFTSGGGTLITGPRWWEQRSQEGAAAKQVVAGAGRTLSLPTIETVDSDRFSSTVRGLVDRYHGAPRLYNVGTIISLYSADAENRRALVQMTEYGDYPTENVTVKFPQKVKRAQWYAIGQPEQDLKVYDGEDGGSEIDLAQVPFYCAIVVEY
jgi:hypothetical protein